MTHHFRASSGSTRLNSRARVEAEGGSESRDGLTAAPMSTPAESAAWRKDWDGERRVSARSRQRRQLGNLIFFSARALTANPGGNSAWRRNGRDSLDRTAESLP